MRLLSGGTDQQLLVPNPVARTLYPDPEYRPHPLGGEAYDVCLKCGALVADRETHTLHHRRFAEVLLDFEQRVDHLETVERARGNRDPRQMPR